MMPGGRTVWSTRVASWLLFAAAILAPLPFGSNVPCVIALWCVVLGICLVLTPVRNLSAGQLALASLAAIVVAAYGFVLHEQIAAHPWLSLAVPHPMWHDAQAALNIPMVPIVSIARDQPLLELGRPLVCVMAIGCGFLVGADPLRARRLITLVAWSGAFYAAYGVLAHILDPTHILWFDKDSYLESLTSTFVNRNTAAAYFGSCAVIWSLLLWESARLEMPRGPLDWRGMASRMFLAPSSKLVIAFAMLFLCLVALFMTGSRGGAILSLFSLIVAFTAFFRRDLTYRAGFVIALAGSGMVTLVLLQLMGGSVNARFDVAGLADEGRLETYKATLRMIADHPWFGSGQGTFAFAFPAYRSPDVSMWGVWDMAHNTLLEIAADMGLPIAGLVLVSWLIIFIVLIRGTLIRQRGLLPPVAALALATLAVLHSLIDFSLQIPGYAIVTLAVIGAGLAQSFPGKRGKTGTIGARGAWQTAHPL
jgi:O-antigen ligase